jgi:acetylornithine deacetylase/succinyl-diaminopimelate desuccinylase-like protein
VIGLCKGSAGGPKLVVSAHLDTVFPEGTDVTVKEKDGVILAPGIGDDSRGLAALSLIQAMNANDVKTVGDVLFVGTVGEEELGNLRGVKACYVTTPTSMVLFQSTGSASPALSIRGPEATAMR